MPRRRYRITRILASLAVAAFLVAAVLQLGLPGVGFEGTLVLTGVGLWAGVLFTVATIVSWIVQSRVRR
jgi:polyferredoxin